jgi:hypothetical protein
MLNNAGVQGTELLNGSAMPEARKAVPARLLLFCETGEYVKPGDATLLYVPTIVFH